MPNRGCKIFLTLVQFQCCFELLCVSVHLLDVFTATLLTVSALLDIGVSKSCQSTRGHEYNIMGDILVTQNTVLHGNQNDC